MAFSWKDTLSKVAPLAGTMIGGPWGALAGQAIGKVFGHTDKEAPTDEQMGEYVRNATPEQLVELKGIDANLKIRLKELGVKEDELVYADKDSARKMQMENKSKVPATLAILLTVGVFSMFIALMIFDVPVANAGTVYLIVGSVLAAWVGSVQFYFGTTKSSQEKTQLMANKK